MAKQNYGLYFIVVMVVIGILVLPSALQGLSDWASDFWADFWAPFGGDDTTDDTSDDNATVPTGGGASEGTMTYRLTIGYKDGTEKTYAPDLDNPFALVPLIINDEYGFEIDHFTVEIEAKATWQGDLQSWSINGHYTEVVDGVEIGYYDISDSGGTTFGNTANRKIIYSNTRRASVFQIALTNHQISEGVKEMVFDGTFDLTMNFKDGSKDTATSIAPTMVWTFQYFLEQGKINNFTVAIFPDGS